MMEISVKFESHACFSVDFPCNELVSLKLDTGFLKEMYYFKCESSIVSCSVNLCFSSACHWISNTKEI